MVATRSEELDYIAVGIGWKRAEEVGRKTRWAGQRRTAIGKRARDGRQIIA